MEIVEVLKALSDETRLRIMNVLRKDTLCVCDLEEILKLSQSNVSRHLTKLRSCKLIKSKKDAQWVYYSLDNGFIDKHLFLTELLAHELDKLPQCRKDLSRLKKYRELGGDCTHAVKVEGE